MPDVDETTKLTAPLKSDEMMDQHAIQALFQKFAAPLAGYAATSPERKDLAEMLVRNLWMAMIAGPEMEDETWKVFKKHANLTDESLQPIQQVYFEEMKAVLTAEQIAFLRQRYLKQ